MIKKPIIYVCDFPGCSNHFELNHRDCSAIDLLNEMSKGGWSVNYEKMWSICPDCPRKR